MTGATRFGPIVALACAGLLVGCATPGVVKHASPPIGETLGDLAQPKVNVLPIIKSEPIAADPQKAIENYRQLLKLNPGPKLRSEAERRIADLQVQVEDQNGNPAKGMPTLDRAIDTYRSLIRKHPHARNNARILYQLARAYQNTGQSKKAIDTLLLMQKEYPGSSLMGDAHFRAAELLYQQKRYAEAADEYRVVMDLGKGTPFYEPAEYKFGWSLFKQHKYQADIAAFFRILNAELPSGRLEDPKAALAKVAKGKRDLTRDALRVVSLSFAVLGGGSAINHYFEKHPEPQYYPLIYNALGSLFLKKQRYTDAAEAYAAFIKRYPDSPSAAKFQTEVIAAYKAGGFGDEVLREKQRYANTYAPGSPYWGGKQPTATVMATLRTTLEQLGRHAQAVGDKKQAAGQQAASEKDFAAAANWYRRILNIYPKDPHAANINLMLADSLYDGGKTREAALQYEKTAYGYGKYPKASDAALAAVQAWQHLAKTAPPQQRPAILRQSVAASLKMADHFPKQDKWVPVLTQAAVNLYELKQRHKAILVAQRVLNTVKKLTDKDRRIALGVIGDSYFDQKRYSQAAAAYTKLLKLTPAGDPKHHKIVEQLAMSIYQQGQTERNHGKLRLAAQTFLKIGKLVPGASIRPTADYNAAAALIALKDWTPAEQVLEHFRASYPHNKLIPGVDKKLAVAYQSNGQPFKAAQAYQRIANRQSETPAVRRAAAWQTASLYDKAHKASLAQVAYMNYAGRYPMPLDRAMDARKRVVDIAHAQHDQATRLEWLRKIVAANAAAGPASDEKSQTMAAHANLQLGIFKAHNAESLQLTQPLKQSLALKKSVVNGAADQLAQAANSGIAGVATQATYELGVLYNNFAQSIINSQRPNGLSGAEAQQYTLLLEEHAEPMIDKAVKTHEANLQRVAQGYYDAWVGKSVTALAQLSPGKYGKREKNEASYDALH